ncbi:hypothetical protein NP493_1899g00003 [Ridgeia piscesae]|uniref:Reverse transcriptase n=1 Tax=Ridgeia piscesae TaxID=27915 RepID=A0AAD9N572_RIDPI|nr:hypothetical protein NP493_1899g00003 [Ridgeia piscesae]
MTAVLRGNFNARIGRDNYKWPLVIGKHGIGKCYSNGELLLALCSEFELIVFMFKQNDERKTTWMHPRSRHWHMIDFIITRCRDKMCINSTRAMCGANCWTDHQMLRSKLAFRIRQKHNRQGTRAIDSYEQKKPSPPETVANQEHLIHHCSVDACRLLQKRTRALKSDRWERKAVQRAADRNNMKGFYSRLKEVWGPKKKGPVHLKSTDGMETFSDSKRVVARWSEHFQKLLNVPDDINHETLDNIPQRVTKTSLDAIPTTGLRWLEQSPKDGKAPGGDGIPAEVWKHGGDNLFSRLHQLITNAWKLGSVPQTWKDASIVTI